MTNMTCVRCGLNISPRSGQVGWLFELSGVDRHRDGLRLHRDRRPRSRRRSSGMRLTFRRTTSRARDA